MRRSSLRFRLTLASALWVLVALLITGVALSYLFADDIEHSLEEELEASHNRLLAVTTPDGPALAADDALPDPRYLTPFGGRYWQIEDRTSGQTSRSRSLWDWVLDVPDPPLPEKSVYLATLPGPDGQSLLALSGSVTFATADGPRHLRVIVAEDRALVDQSIHASRLALIVALAVVGLTVIAASWLQVSFGLRPLRGLARAIEAVRRGDAERVPDVYPEEVRGLVSEVNELLEAREKSIDSARARATDLAHGLKTPISVLTTVADSLKGVGATGSAKTLASVAEEMSERIDYELRLIKLRPRTSSQVLKASLNNTLVRALAVLRKTERGERLHWQCELETDVAVDVDGHDLLELCGTVLENAAKWAETRVQVSVRKEEDRVEVAIEDDGPGLTEEQIPLLGVRGRRLDEGRPGSGLGLAIAIEILAVNRGTIRFSRSEIGGLCATLCLPLARA